MSLQLLFFFLFHWLKTICQTKYAFLERKFSPFFLWICTEKPPKHIFRTFVLNLPQVGLKRYWRTTFSSYQTLKFVNLVNQCGRYLTVRFVFLYLLKRHTHLSVMFNQYPTIVTTVKPVNVQEWVISFLILVQYQYIAKSTGNEKKPNDQLVASLWFIIKLL